MEILKQKSQLFDSFADESLIGEMDTQINENAVMKNIIEEEKKRLGLEDGVEENGAETESIFSNGEMSGYNNNINSVESDI